MTLCNFKSFGFVYFIFLMGPEGYACSIFTVSFTVRPKAAAGTQTPEEMFASKFIIK